MHILHRPYFVYGTLRPGWGNARRWDGLATAVDDGVAAVTGYQMWADFIPYAIHTGDPNDRVVGALIVPDPDPELAHRLRLVLDGLESHPHHYERVATTLAGQPNEWVWIYTPTRDMRHFELRHVPTGDFSDHERSTQLTIT